MAIFYYSGLLKSNGRELVGLVIPVITINTQFI